jgi:hypothetical protein
VGVLLVVAAAIFGADAFGVRESVLGRATPAPRPVAVSPFVSVGTRAARPQSVLRSQPWWQRVRDLSGAATTTTTALKIDAGASQWRGAWSCRTGRLAVQVSAPPHPLLDAACPGTGTAYATQTGNAELRISASGPWTLKVDQQVDVPLEEPPLPAMSAPGATVVRRGTFYRIDQTGTGRLMVYRLATGAYALRLGSFYVSPNIDLEIRLSPLAAPHSTHQFLSTSSVVAAPLPITAGSLNFIVPRGVNPTRYRSVVIWCPLITSAYAAASLTSSG